MFHFDARTFVVPGYEASSGDWSPESGRQIASLRSLYPEFNHWGDLALGGAFANFSQDVFEVNWAEWMFEARNEMFLNYCCWRQTRGAWRSGWDENELAKANDWRASSTGIADSHED